MCGMLRCLRSHRRLWYETLGIGSNGDGDGAGQSASDGADHAGGHYWRRSVFTLVSIGRGSSEAIAKQYESLGTNLLVVNLMGNGRATQLNYQELMQMESLPGFKAVAPTMTKNNSNIKYDRETETFNVIGTNDRYLDMQKGEVASGRFLAQADIDFRNHVAVIGSEVAAKFFGTGDPLGEKLNIDGYVYTIIGSLKSKGSNTSGTSLDSSIFVPLDTLSRDFKLGSIRTTYIEAATSENVAIVQSIVERYLQNKFNSTSGYNIFNSSNSSAQGSRLRVR